MGQGSCLAARLTPAQNGLKWDKLQKKRDSLRKMKPGWGLTPKSLRVSLSSALDPSRPLLTYLIFSIVFSST